MHQRRPFIFGAIRSGVTESLFVMFNVVATEIIIAILFAKVLPSMVIEGLAKFSMVFIPLSAVAIGIRKARREWNRKLVDARRAAGECTCCGYDLRESQSGVCPECGRNIRGDQSR